MVSTVVLAGLLWASVAALYEEAPIAGGGGGASSAEDWTLRLSLLGLIVVLALHRRGLLFRKRRA